VDKLPGIGKQTAKVLNSIGVHTIGDLSRIPPHTLEERFGTSWETMLRHASGIDNSRVLPPGEAKSISRETTFGEDTRDRKYLEATLWAQSEKVGADLRKRGKEAKCITLKLRYGDFSTITRSRTLPESLNTDRVIFEIGINLLNKALSAQKQGVRLIGIGVSHLGEPTQQASLFTPSNRKLEELNKTIDRIRDRYGFNAIKTGRTVLLKDLISR
jgi:DNA polymerase-4